MEKTTLYLPAELHRQLKEISRRSGRPQAALVRDALTAYLAQQERPVLRSIGAGSNPDFHGADIEDWLAGRMQPIPRSQ